MAEERNFNLMQTLNSMGSKAAEWIRHNRVARAVVVVAAFSVPMLGFANGIEASEHIAANIHEPGIVSTMDMSHISSHMIADFLDNPLVQQAAVSDVVIPDTGYQNSNIAPMADIRLTSIELGAKYHYNPGTAGFHTDKAEFREYNGDGSYAYFPVRSSGKNDDVKLYVGTPADLRHNDYTMGRNESRDNADYGFKVQRDQQRRARMMGREYKPGILNDKQFEEFKRLCGPLTQKNARLVPVFSDWSQFSQYKVEDVRDLGLKESQYAELLSEYGKHFTKECQAEMRAIIQGMGGPSQSQPGMEPVKAQQVIFSADTAQFVADGNGHGQAVVSVEVEARNSTEAARIGRMYALKELNQEGRIEDGKVTSLTASMPEQVSSGQYRMMVNVGGVLPPDPVREASDRVAVQDIQVGMEMVSDTGRQVVTPAEFRSQNAEMLNNPLFKDNLEQKLSEADRLNSELKGVDFSVKDNHQTITQMGAVNAGFESNTVSKPVSQTVSGQDRQAVERSEVLRQADLQTFDAAPLKAAGKEVYDISHQCMDSLKAEYSAQRDLDAFNQKYNTGSFFKDNFNRLKDGLTGDKFNQAYSSLVDQKAAAGQRTEKLSEQLKTSFQNYKGLADAAGLDSSVVKEQVDACQAAVFDGNYGKLDVANAGLNGGLEVMNKAADQKAAVSFRNAAIASVSRDSMVLPDMSAGEYYKVRMSQELYEKGNFGRADSRVLDSAVVKEMLSGGMYSKAEVTSALNKNSANFVAGGKRAEVLVDKIQDQLSSSRSTKERSEMRPSRESSRSSYSSDDYSR